mmetsp:Transcript_42462/g.76308  ORF Transcript_42462/g.76308 Transcript_42462/m.76308 type:complete len:237 (+) Transcript_42462:87-797(+)|eukprot:CAMPEP_0197664810 /NCGR_PEP_ID=MMETSP1338-20131121/58864_1 /TAXON_ID=43686 ORGANISM="Pelagodinium beii, Strain RCC1491" /NCGR_SAMPLE_ID=MMETSP1338 /ASSEMBLY_ACC=CAM_ASM_000754 /LENGTH=236 /DNA_ID=CAMNT_0043243527 /DNA_START=83 /DNA_END=793 /DNA_ORIENTATION=+
MSYSTLDRFLNVKTTYAPANKNTYVKGIWWPDYGPTTTEFVDQHKMHPTNTIFETQVVRHTKAHKEVLAEPMGASSSKGSKLDQFRRQPATEALWSSTIIQPYKSGGAAKEKMEGAWNSKARAASLAHEEAQATMLAKRTMDKQTITASMSPMRSLSSPTLGFGNSLGGGSMMSSLVLESQDTPPWIAKSTFGSRPMDGAGLGGGPNARVYKDGASEIGLDPESATATVIARTRRR